MLDHVDWTTSEGGRVVFGVGLVVAGVILIAHRLDIFDAFALWPLVFVGVGLLKMLGACCSRQRRHGAWWLGLGSWFSLNQFTTLGYRQTWPLLLVLWGGLMAWDAVADSRRCARCAEAHHGR